MKADLKILERKLGYTFKNQQLLQKALTHRSMRVEHNERLEFLGDSILNFIIAYAVYQQFPHAQEGDLSRYRAQLVCEETLADLALEFDLSAFLILGVGELKSGGFRRKSILADAVEALIAGVYLDSDLLVCQQLVEKWFAQRLAQASQVAIKKDSKTMLQEYLQAEQLALPFYKIVKISGKDHAQIFHVSCSVSGFGEETLGEGSSRRIAEQKAAADFLNKLLKKRAEDG
jgi:ribonuclease III